VLPNNLFEYLRIEHGRLKLLDKTFSESDYIVHMNGSKEPYRPDVFSQKFKRFIARNHLKKIRFHDIRHTFATQMLASGVPAKVIQKILGHSEISTTLDTYTEVLQSVEDDVAEKINKKIFGE
jgi:integrase